MKKKYTRPSALGPDEVRRQFIDLRSAVIDLYEEALKLHYRLEKVEKSVSTLQIQERRRRLESAKKPDA